MRPLTEAQRLMVEDGLPADLILSAEDRAASWKGKRLRPTNSFADPKRPTKDEDPATKQLRKEMAAAEEGHVPFAHVILPWMIAGRAHLR
jgi:hypothetical protein